MSWTDELAQEIPGRVLTDDATREVVATDFGRIVVRRPQVVVCPASTDDVARVVKFAARNTFLIDPTGRIAKIFTSVDPAKHSVEVLAELDQLEKTSAAAR